MSLPVSSILEGEILGADDLVRVVGSLHPLKMERIEYYVAAGSSIAEIVQGIRSRQTTGLANRLAVRIEGDPIPERLWTRVRPKKGVTVTFLAIAEGGAGGGDATRSILGIVVAVAALVVAPYLAPIIAGAGASAFTIGLIQAGIGAAITVGGMLAVNALFPARKPQLNNQTAETTTYSIGGARNEARNYGAIPVVLGRHRMSPPYVTQPYTEIVGDDQYLRVAFCWGYGPVDLSALKIGDTALTAFDDVTVEHILGTVLDQKLSLFPSEVFEEQLQIELVYGDRPQRTTEPDITEISVDISFPNGLMSVVTKTGLNWSYTVPIVVQYRKTGTSTWLTAFYTNVSDSRKTAIRRGFRWTVAKGQYDVRVYRDSALFTANFANVVEDVYWIAVRAMRNESPIQSDDKLAYTALRIRATAQLNGTLDSFSGLVRSRCKHWTGTYWADDQFTSNPADLARYVLQHPANKRAIPDSKLDLPAFEAWASYCFAQGFEFNQVRESAASVYETVQDIAGAGRAVIGFKDGKWSPIWDERDLPIVQHFTPRNSWGFQSSRVYKRRPHALRMSFINEDANYKQDERLVYDDGYGAGNATDFESIEQPGVTDSKLIWRHGRFHIAQVKLRPEKYTLQTDFENLICTRGDRVRVQHDVPLWGQISARVVAVNTGTRVVTLDENVIIESGKTYSARFRAADGTSRLFGGLSGSGETRNIQLGGTATLPLIGELMSWGEANLETVVLRVLSVSPGENLTATLELVDDAPEISAADEGAIPSFKSNITAAVDPLFMKPQSIAVVEYLYAEGDAVLVGVRISWVVIRIGAATGYEVMVRDESIQPPFWRTLGVVTAPQTEIVVPGFNAGNYSFAVRALFPNNKFSDWTYLFNQKILGLTAPPGDIADFNIAVLAEYATLTWTPITVLNFAYYEIRFAPILTGASWSAATVLMTNIRTAQVQVPAMIGTYLIKAYTKQGIQSVNAVSISSDVASNINVNVVQTIAEDPGFSGLKTNVLYEPTRAGLILTYQGDTFAIADWFGPSDFFMLGGGSGFGFSDGYYNFSNTTDLGAVYTSRVTSTVIAYGEVVTDDFFASDDFFTVEDWFGIEATDWDVVIEARKTDDNPAGSPTWSSWFPVNMQDVTARAMQFRAHLISNRNALTPVVTNISMVVDMPDRIVHGDNIAVGTGGATITFNPPFKVLHSITRSDQNMQTGDYATVTGKSASGFTIQFKNAAGAGVARTFDYHAKGYGAVVP